MPVDTSLYTSHDFNPGLGNINLGHLGSPVQYHQFYQRERTPFLFFQPYYPYLRNNRNTQYFQARKPFTFLKFATGGQQDTEARLWVKHTQNINKAVNLGLDVDLIGAKTFYENDRSLKGRFLNFFGSYRSDGYSLYGNLNINKIKLKETGGIEQRSDFEDRIQRYIPGNLEKANNMVKNNTINLIQKLSLKKTNLSELDVFQKLGDKETFRKQSSLPQSDTLNADSIENTTPVNTVDTLPHADTLAKTDPSDSVNVREDSSRFYLYHRLSYSTYEKRYQDQNPDSEFYDPYPIYMDSTKTRDQAIQKSFMNRIRLVYANNFLTLYTGMDYNIINYAYGFPYQLSDTSKDYHRLFSRKYNNLSLNAGWDFFSDSLFSLWANGEYNLSGFHGGDFTLKGGLNLKLNRNDLNIRAKYHYHEPDYFYQFYHSNHFRWNQRLPKVSALYLDGSLYLHNIQTLFSLKPAVIHNYTYLDTNAVATQYPGNLKFIAAVVKKAFHLGKFVSTNTLVLQYSDQDPILGMPTLFLKHRFAFRHKFHFQVTGGNLYTQIGWSLSYYPAYHTDAYMPALGLFHRQQTEKLGNKPLFNLFVNFRVKRMNLFGKLYHLNSHIQERNYYTAPSYPQSPMMLKFGLSWSFYD